MTTINDGTAQFIVGDKRVQALFNAIYPVGIIVATQTTECPFEFGVWQEVAKDRVLQGGDNVGSTIDAGLPNITGEIKISNNVAVNQNANVKIQTPSDVANNAFNPVRVNSVETVNVSSASTIIINQSDMWNAVTFSAQSSNQVYGNSSTVQSPAYVVKYWLRTA